MEKKRKTGRKVCIQILPVQPIGKHPCPQDPTTQYCIKKKKWGSFEYF